MGTLMILVILCLSGHAVQAWNEPAGFRDIPWGASVAQVQHHLPMFTMNHYDMPPSCAGDLSIGDIPVFASITFGPKGMDAVNFLFRAQHFVAMKETFIARYGAPPTRDMLPMRNGL